MEPSGLSINPPVKVEWKGDYIYVGSAREALRRYNIQFEERDEFLTAIYNANPMLVSNPNAQSVQRLHLGDVQQYLKALKSRWLDSKIPLVSEDEAKRRSTICEICPSKSKASGCFGCSGISKLLMHIPKSLMGNTDVCGVCRCYLNNKVWMGKEVISEDNRSLEYPENCWIHEVFPPESQSDDK